MKVRCYFKDPDTMPDAVNDAVDKLPVPDGISENEWDTLKEGRADEAAEYISKRWMEYSEYLMVEFDTEAGTATVLERGKY